MNQTFTCADCGKTFASDWSNDDAMAESTRLFGNVAVADLVVICDDCFQQGMAVTNGGAA